MIIHLISATSKEDALLLNQLATKIWQEHYIPIIGADQVSYMLTNLQSADKMFQDIQSGMTYYLIQVIKADGTKEWAGYAGFEIRADHLFLSKLYVLADFRQLGIGSFVFQHILKEAKSSNLPAIQLTVNKYNDKSIAAYQKMGFTTIKEQVADIGGGYVMDDYVMEYRIS